MANPKKAIAALLPPAIDCGEGASVHPMTLAMWAALERIESPLITGKPAKDTMDLLPSLYLLTHGRHRLAARHGAYSPRMRRADNGRHQRHS